MQAILPDSTSQALAAAVAQRLYGFRTTGVVPLGGGRGLLRVEFGGLPAKVIRLPGSLHGMRREQQVLGAMRRPRWSMPVPAIEFTERDLPPRWRAGGTTWSRPVALSVFRHEPGMTLADAILRGEPWADEAMSAAGALLARLSEFPRAFLGWRSAAGPMAVLSHGRLGADRILVEPSAAGVRICVVGWTRARLAPPLTDLASLLTSLAMLPLRDTGQLAYLRRRAIDGFAALNAADGLEVRLAALAAPGVAGA